MSTRDYIDERGTRLRRCCDTTHSRTHTDDCPEWGDAARSAKACAITSDGWCAAHSTAAGPSYCLPAPTPDDAEGKG